MCHFPGLAVATSQLVYTSIRASYKDRACQSFLLRVLLLLHAVRSPRNQLKKASSAHLVVKTRRGYLTLLWNGTRCRVMIGCAVPASRLRDINFAPADRESAFSTRSIVSRCYSRLLRHSFPFFGAPALDSGHNQPFETSPEM